jgi:citrate lyase subunit beta / citryl-CoA lyase
MDAQPMFEEATAGKPNIPSDLHVTIKPSAEGGIELELTSKVTPYYGQALRNQITALARGLGLSRARIIVNDQGALPFTVAARVEAAIRRAGHKIPALRSPSGRKDRPGSPRDRLRRSRLYLPGGEPKFFVNARLHRPDAVILDLEDSVHPSEKDAARILVREALGAVDFGEAEVMVRINQLPLGFADLEEIVPAFPDLILLPKVESALDVQEVDAALDVQIQRLGVERPLWLMPILESALGIENAFAIASASPRIVAITLGVEDLTADLGVVKTSQGDETLFARYRVVNAAKAAGIQAIDSVYGDVSDAAGLLAYGRRSRAMGFEGMGCIHPRQVPIIHEAYAPLPEEIEKALRIMEAYADATARGLGVVSLGSKMIDPPVVKRAERLVALARDMGLLPVAAPAETR